MSEVRRLKTRGRGLEYVLVELYDYQPQVTETSLLQALLSALYICQILACPLFLKFRSLYTHTFNTIDVL